MKELSVFPGEAPLPGLNLIDLGAACLVGLPSLAVLNSNLPPGCFPSPANRFITTIFRRINAKSEIIEHCNEMET